MANKSKPKTTSAKQPTIKYDTKMGTIADKYGVNLGVPSDTKFGTYLIDKGYGSLSEMLRS